MSDTATLNAYVAGSTKEINEVREAQAICRQHGYRIIFDWTDAEEGDIRSDWSDDPVAAERHAVKERGAVEASDLVVFLFTERGLGSKLETGMAMRDDGTQVVCIDNQRESVFYYLPNVTRIHDVLELPDVLEQL